MKRFLIVIVCLISVQLALPCELLIKATNATHSDAEEDRRGCYKRGMIVEVRGDGADYGAKEGLPKFVVIKIPGVSPAQAIKYVAAQLDGLGEVYRRRLWQIRWADLPLAARNKLASTGELIIKVGAYEGPYDYTWAQVKGFFRNLETGLDETEDL